MNWNNFNAHRRLIIASKQQISSGIANIATFKTNFCAELLFLSREITINPEFCTCALHGLKV